MADCGCQSSLRLPVRGRLFRQMATHFDDKLARTCLKVKCKSVWDCRGKTGVATKELYVRKLLLINFKAMCIIAEEAGV